MEVFETIQCPFCGETFDLGIDTSSEDLVMVSDCEVCCRPMSIHVRCVPGEVEWIQVDAG